MQEHADDVARTACDRRSPCISTVNSASVSTRSRALFLDGLFHPVEFDARNYVPVSQPSEPMPDFAFERDYARSGLGSSESHPICDTMAPRFSEATGKSLNGSTAFLNDAMRSRLETARAAGLTT